MPIPVLLAPALRPVPAALSPRTLRPARTLALVAALSAAAAAHAGRPLAVDDAGVNDRGNGHVEVWWEGNKGKRGAAFVAPAYAPVDGLELGAVLGRDRQGSDTLYGLQAKWLWSPAQDSGCNAASSAALLRSRQGSDTAYTVALIGTCAGDWGRAHANLGGVREPAATWQPRWGLAYERPLGPVTVHAEAFGVRRSPVTLQAGARWEVAPGWQLDATIGPATRHGNRAECGVQAQLLTGQARGLCTPYPQKSPRMRAL
jgi:hypothetical protein